MKAMIIVTVIYSQKSGTFFDLDYYFHKHVPMVKTVLGHAGLQDFRCLRGTESAAGGAPTSPIVALLTFENAEVCRGALAQFSKQIFDDIPNFTDMKAAVQMNEAIEA